eukprot:TRINITY_DN16114_c0_g1_i3.p1 TRINITY_DN16114_c0_g1~~TRINITY_DN16114_c0_g1_i3.p1  ORF type:complete len:265 (-),score=31.10 TRINITY_DN16114_c0_g1_i3:106-900(-)
MCIRDRNCTNQTQTDMTHVDDIFDFGVLMLLCAVGKDIQILNKEYESEEILRGNRLLQQKSPKMNEGKCCLLHLILENSKSCQNIYLNEQSCDYIQMILQNSGTFSPKFIQFLCKCLKLREKDRSNPQELLQSDYLKQIEEFNGTNVSLTELINISNNQIELSQAHEQLERMCSKLAIVIPECNTLFNTPQGRVSLQKLQNMGENDLCIANLSKHFGLPRYIILEKINNIMKDVNNYKPQQQNGTSANNIVCLLYTSPSPRDQA